MAGQFFSLHLMGVENSSLDPVLISIGRTIRTLHQGDSQQFKLLTPGENHAFKILMLQENSCLAFSISKLAHVFTVTEGVGKGSLKLEVIGSNGQFKVHIEDSSTITIEDVSGAYVFRYNGASYRRYHLVADGNNLKVTTSN